jgi:hypothetical protein
VFFVMTVSIVESGIVFSMFCQLSNQWNKLLSLFSFSKEFFNLFGCSMWRSCLHPIQVLRGGVAWSRVSSKIPFFVMLPRRMALKSPFFLWSTDLVPARPLS